MKMTMSDGQREMSHAMEETLTSARSALKQLPGWLAVALLATAIACTTWAWATEDTTAGLVGTASLILSVVVALALERAPGQYRQTFTKETHD